jgi:hypothetical protein
VVNTCVSMKPVAETVHHMKADDSRRPRCRCVFYSYLFHHWQISGQLQFIFLGCLFVVMRAGLDLYVWCNLNWLIRYEGNVALSFKLQLFRSEFFFLYLTHFILQFAYMPHHVLLTCGCQCGKCVI